MVATRLYEISSKGKDWACGKSSVYDSPRPISHQQQRDSSVSPYDSSISSATTSATQRRDESLSSSYWSYANDSLQYAAESTYSRIANILSSLYTGESSAPPFEPHRRAGSIHTATGDDDDDSLLRGAPRRHSRNLNSADLAMMFKNPYNSVRGRHARPASMSAVRMLLTMVPDEDQAIHMPQLPEQTPTSLSEATKNPVFFAPQGIDASIDNTSLSPIDSKSQTKRRRKKPVVSPSERASQIAEGTIRALRDMALDEAVELHIALRYWSERWERPLLSWLEAGPQVWTSPEGYNHQKTGHKVSQIQAVLARRCAAIGELQQHLLRAGWQQGVAQWGVLGHGGQWAAVAGFDASMMDDGSRHAVKSVVRQRLPSDIGDDRNVTFRQDAPLISQKTEDTETDNASDLHPPPHFPPPLHPTQRNLSRQESTANVLVRRKAGGGIFVDDPAFLVEWSVQAIALVRKQLERASMHSVPMPYQENWIQDNSVHGEEGGKLIIDRGALSKIPLWAGERTGKPVDMKGSDASVSSVEPRSGLVITNLHLMAEEVSEILNVMEDAMEIQRRRRLEVLKPPGWMRQNWYITAALVPSVSYLLYKMLLRGHARHAIKLAAGKISYFLRERVREPVVAIFNELWKGRESFSDREARMEAIESLKKMIRSWLDDTFPLMAEAKRAELSEAMDVTLVEQQKVESMKTFFEINNVIRMSFIEMQYMKKELLNALDAIDTMMSANDINMNLAAITPVAMLVYLQIRLFKFMYYAMLKLGKSREETYSSFRSILTDIERLLVMRDRPPISAAPPPKYQGRTGRPPLPTQPEGDTAPPVQLSADDLGMLMLLIHECRSIMWRNRRRFTPGTISSVAEDLAELAGERGAVSVQQQLRIVERMFRSYSFLQLTVATGRF